MVLVIFVHDTMHSMVQVFVQPIFGFVEKWSKENWTESQFINGEHTLNIPLCGSYNVNFFRVVWRTAYVIITAVVAMLLPFFNDFLALIGALSFWPLTVYFPIEMYIKKSNMQRFSFTWTWLKILSWVCLIISIISLVGSIQGLSVSIKKYKPFQAEQQNFHTQYSNLSQEFLLRATKFVLLCFEIVVIFSILEIETTCYTKVI